MPLGLTLQQITFLIILVAAFALLLTEVIRRDLVAVLIIVALSVTGLLTPEEALSGFSSEPAIVLAGIFVLTGALELTGVSRTIGAWIERAAGNTYTRAIAVIMPAVALMAAFAEHVTTTAVMLPITISHAKEKGIPVSKLLMPMAFAASLGSAITIIGAPAFLVSSAALQQAGREGLSIFSITPIGLALMAAGTLYVLVLGRFLLPSREGGGDLLQRFQLDRYFTEMVVLPESPLIGQTYMQMKERGTYNFTVTRWIRGGQTLRVPFADLTFEDGDILIIETTPGDLVTIRQEQGIDLRPVEEYKDHMPVQERGDDADIPEQLVQAVIAPHAEFVGQSIGEVDFREHFGVVVLGLWRQSGLIRDEIAKVKLEAGDVLVMQGHDDGIEKVRAHPGFLMMVPFAGEGRSPRKALTAAAIMIGAMVLAGTGLLELDIAMLAGAAGVVLTRCITPRQAYRSIDQRIFVFIAGAIPLGLAMRTSGVSDLLAEGLANIVRPWEPFWILIAIFFIVSWLTQIMSDAATVALFAPVVISLASALGLPPEPFVVTVAMAAVASFWTPIGHHGNMLIYSPGRYTFKDFILVGGVLTVIVAFIVATLTLALWGTLPPV